MKVLEVILVKKMTIDLLVNGQLNKKFYHYTQNNKLK